MKLEVIPTTPDHIAPLAATLRPADLAEIAASTWTPPEAVIRRSVAASTHCWTGMVGDQPVCIAGGGPTSLLSGEGFAWLMAAPPLEQFPRTFLVQTKARAAEMLTVYRVLRNQVDARNAKTLSWLRRLGAVFAPPAPYGPKGLPFIAFEIRAG